MHWSHSLIEKPAQLLIQQPLQYVIDFFPGSPAADEGTELKTCYCQPLTWIIRSPAPSMQTNILPFFAQPPRIHSSSLAQRAGPSALCVILLSYL